MSIVFLTVGIYIFCRTNPLATYTYKDGNGRLKKITYANGDYMTATYNSIGQLVTEKWYDESNTLTAHYKYSYDHNGNIVRSIDIFAGKEYNYMYEEGRIVRASQCTIAMSGDNVVSKNVDYSISYIYDTDGKITRKFTSEDSGILGGTFYEYDKNDGTVVLYNDNGKTVTIHSKTDSFGRKEFDEIQLGTGFVSRKFSYLDGITHSAHIENNKLKSYPTTNLVSEIVMSDDHVLSYEYDKEERITKVTDAYVDTTTNTTVSTVTDYEYDALGQLVKEIRDGVDVNRMEYDNYGNIIDKNGNIYTYDATWKDLLTEYNGQAITYDAQGNPTTYLGHTLTWEKGRQLHSFDSNEYTYNANGIRTSKTVGGVVHNYLLDGAKILRETWNVDNTAHTLETLWDNEDAICGIKYNGASYYFLKNLQGDIIAITDNNGAVVARYSYDAWGVPNIVSDTSTIGIATINPFRYRGYYYDSEIGMYYLQSRYYNPVVGRFVNGDMAEYAIISVNANGHNLYYYCNNGPVNYSDPWGYASTADFWEYANSLPIFQSTRNVAGFSWDSAQGIWYSQMYPIQRSFGYCDLYDNLAPLALIFIQHIKVSFNYDKKNWIIWLWKGQYGVTIGAEIGVYIYSPNSRLERAIGQKWYRCAYDSERLQMAFTLYKNGKKIFSRPYQTHWWLTGFKPGVMWFWETLTMDVTINFKSLEMAKAFCKAAGLNVPSSRRVRFSW